MERWKELLKDDLTSVATGFREVGKDAAAIDAIIERLADAAKGALIQWMHEANLHYFAMKLDVGDYDKMVALEEKQKADAEAAGQEANE